MKLARSGALTDLPVGGRWDFGGFAYGLEPLVLPPVQAPDAVDDDPASVASVDAYAEICWLLRTLAEDGVPTPDVERCDGPAELFWFRWITGHQVCFVVWRLIAQLLDDLRQCRRSPDEVLEPISRFVDGYSAMLLYTGSCPPDIYNVLIRPSMRLRHRAFSGGWAPDYWPIRDLFWHRRQLPPMPDADTGELSNAIALLHLVHDGVAARLVTNGKSLLREASVRGPNPRTAGMIYDTYFMTVRRSVPRHEVVAQLLRRLVAIARDIAANDLYANDDGDNRPAELQKAEVVKCENSLIDIMLWVARCACELTVEPAQPLHQPSATP